MKKWIKMSNVVLVALIVLLILFTMRVLHIVETGGYEPSTLITAVFAATLGEFGIMGWIKNTKTRYGTEIDGIDYSSDDDDSEGVG